MYNLYTEDIHRRMVEKILSRHFRGFTETTARGFWEGKPEKSLVISVADARGSDIKQAATEIKRANKQQAVLVVKSQTEDKLI